MVVLNFDARTVPPLRIVTLTFGSSRTETRWVDRRTLHFRELAEMLSRAEVGPKDGPCYVPATFSGHQRRLDQAEEIDVAVLDADCGHTMEEIRAAVQAHGWEAVIHSTYSHMTDITGIATGPYEKWAAANPTGTVEGYMLAKKGYLPRVVAGAQIARDHADADERMLEVKHNPCPKYRVVLPLSYPWVAAEHEDIRAAAALWRERITALAAALGLHHDQSCTDTSRLFYLPRIKPGQPFEFEHLSGEACPIWTLPEGSAAGATQAGLFDVGAPAPRAEPQVWRAEDGSTFDLEEWAAEYGDRFEIATAIRARAPDLLGSRVSGVKQHILCPWDDAHTSAPGDRTGTFVVDASRIGQAGLSARTGFYIGCSHAGCAGRDRLSFVARLLDDGKLTPADLVDPAFLVAARPLPMLRPKPKAPVPPGEAKIGNIPARLFEDLPGVLGEMYRFILAGASKPQPTMALPAALAMMAAAIGRKTKVEGWGTRPNIYAFCVAVSGAGKQRPITAVKQVLAKAGLFEKLVKIEGISSDAAINSAVVEAPAQVMLLDELGFLLSSTNGRNAASFEANIIQSLLKLYSASGETYLGKAYANPERNKTVEQPCVSLFGASTPDKLFNSLSSADISAGLLSRAVLFDAGEHDPYPGPADEPPVPEAVVQWLQAWDAVPLNENLVELQGGKEVVRPRVVGITADAHELMERFGREMHDAKTKARKVGLDAVYVRAHENALKFSMVRACAHGTENLLIQADDARWATDLARATTEHMAKVSGANIADTPFQRQVKAVMAAVESGADDEEKRQGQTFKDLARRKTCQFPDRELKAVRDHLISAGRVMQVNTNRPGVKRRMAYVSADYHQDEGDE